MSNPNDTPAGLLSDLVTDLHIGGKAVPAADGRRFDVVDPATGRTITTVADAGVDDAIDAVDAAEEAAPAWAATAPRQRAEILRRAFDLMTRGAEDLARLISLENGKAITDARGEVAYAAEFFRWSILREEIFGPVAPIVTFEDEEQAVTLANATEFGLVGYVYTGDLTLGLRVSEALEFGMIALNRGLVSDSAAPFGGSKQSGIGREGGHDGMLDYLESKYIAVQW
jgi:acyl-CoA reductase-like NAD-dependent aldehyde dehydrogenase